jgi:hypothetical protein
MLSKGPRRFHPSFTQTGCTPHRSKDRTGYIRQLIKYHIVESRCGFPSKKRYRCFVGGDNTNVLIIERQWESLAAMEAAYEKVFADQEWQALGAEGVSIIESDRHELYAPLL